MALRLSTGFRKQLMGGLAVVSAVKVGASISLTKNESGNDTISDSGGGFITSGFKPNRYVHISGATTAENDGDFLVSAVTANTITLSDAGILSLSEAFPATGVLSQARGMAGVDLLQNGVIRIFAGTQPETADAVETGTFLVEFTLSAGAFTPGYADNGLVWYDYGSGLIGKPAAASWQGVCEATGTMGWFRCYDNSRTTGASTSAVRFDGSVSTSGSNMTGTSVAARAGTTVSIDTWTLQLPTS